MFTLIEQDLLNDPSTSKVEAFPFVWKTYYPQIKLRAKKCQNRAFNTGVLIHESDFESRFCLALWEASIAFSEHPTYRFMHICEHRLRLAELKLWQSMKVPGNKFDKDKQTFQKGFVVSDNFSNELPLISEPLALHHFFDILAVFKKEHEVEGKIMYLLYLGFTPSEAIEFLYKEPYTNKYRKKIARSRELFKRYYYDF